MLFFQILSFIIIPVLAAGSNVCLHPRGLTIEGSMNFAGYWKSVVIARNGPFSELCSTFSFSEKMSRLLQQTTAE